jgi:hypothetical protein
MSKESFTTIDQITRDMKAGVFPNMSEASKRELAERQRIFDIALSSIKVGTPGVSDAIQRGIARSIAMKLTPTSEPPPREYNGGDTPPI